jgi:hypothetical protein
VSGPIRVVLAVALAAALLAVGLPAADRATDARAASRLDRTATALVERAERLATRHDATRGGAAGRTVRLRVPTAGRLRVDGNGTVAWRVGGGHWHRREPSVALAPAGDALHLGPGRHRLRLSLRRRSGRAVVRIRPAG